MPQVGEMITSFGERVATYWANGQVKLVINGGIAVNAFALADEPGSLQIYEDAAGAWWISYPNSSTGVPVRYTCNNRVNWTAV
jgi:hypothetical protein